MFGTLLDKKFSLEIHWRSSSSEGRINHCPRQGTRQDKIGPIPDWRPPQWIKIRLKNGANFEIGSERNLNPRYFWIQKDEKWFSDKIETRANLKKYPFTFPEWTGRQLLFLFLFFWLVANRPIREMYVADSVTRLGEISPLWQYTKNLGQFCKCLFSF